MPNKPATLQEAERIVAGTPVISGRLSLCGG
jgi:hypothetical protein